MRESGVNNFNLDIICETCHKGSNSLNQSSIKTSICRFVRKVQNYDRPPASEAFEKHSTTILKFAWFACANDL